MTGAASQRGGSVSETWARRLAQTELDADGGGWVLHLGPIEPADLVILRKDGTWELIEAKASKRRRSALKAPLSEPQLALQRQVLAAGLPYTVWRMHRKGKVCELLVRESAPTERARAPTRA